MVKNGENDASSSRLKKTSSVEVFFRDKGNYFATECFRLIRKIIATGIYRSLFGQLLRIWRNVERSNENKPFVFETRLFPLTDGDTTRSRIVFTLHHPHRIRGSRTGKSDMFTTKYGLGFPIVSDEYYHKNEQFDSLPSEFHVGACT